MIPNSFFRFLESISQQGFTYFVIAVIFLVILADKHAEALKDGYPATQEASLEPMPIAVRTKADSLIDFALTLNGIPYRYAGSSLQGFDCSGFTYFVYRKFDIPIPRASWQQYNVGFPISKDEIRKGDLLFFTGPKSETVGHVGIAITDHEEDKLEFIHSSSGGGGRGVTVDSLSHPHYTVRFLGARRINEL